MLSGDVDTAGLWIILWKAKVQNNQWIPLHSSENFFIKKMCVCVCTCAHAWYVCVCVHRYLKLIMVMGILNCQARCLRKAWTALGELYMESIAFGIPVPHIKKMAFYFGQRLEVCTGGSETLLLPYSPCTIKSQYRQNLHCIIRWIITKNSISFSVTIKTHSKSLHNSLLHIWCSFCKAASGSFQLYIGLFRRDPVSTAFSKSNC